MIPTVGAMGMATMETIETYDIGRSTAPLGSLAQPS